jgi:hypothetical protein
MNAKITCLSAVLLFTGAFAAGANAEYRCTPAASALDQRACEAAEQGPDALRRFVYRWDHQMSNLMFSDYVDAKTARAWETTAQLERQRSTEASVKVASN